MSTPSDPARPVPAARTADEVNEDIRALWARAGGRLTTEQRQQYQCLVMEWSAARQAPRRPAPARERSRHASGAQRGPHAS
ncbi:hypothetical protein ACSMX9_00735 [Streptomyces sp. LE64]|uniref:hypothetical protein n=1 Tax=Streptomyces sp. LE64 TaxID=3448653 RepID=UPI00404325FF